MRKKGQAAMEFLMTYGWAILAAIIVIGVLAVYFRPSTLIQDSFIVTAPWYGVGSVIVSTAAVDVEIQNNGGETLTLAATPGILGSCTTVVANPSGAISAGDKSVLSFTSCGLTSGDTFNEEITISYTRPDSNLALSSTGTVTGRVP